MKWISKISFYFFYLWFLAVKLVIMLMKVRLYELLLVKCYDNKRCSHPSTRSSILWSSLRLPNKKRKKKNKIRITKQVGWGWMWRWKWFGIKIIKIFGKHVKNREKADFGQGLECATPNCWSKSKSCDTWYFGRTIWYCKSL